MIEHHHNHIDQRERWAGYSSIDAQPSLSPQLTTNQISCIIYPSCIDAQRIFPHKSLSTSASFALILVPAPSLYQSFTRFHAQAQKRTRTNVSPILSLPLSACRPSVRMIWWSSILSRAVCLYQCLRWCKHTFFVEWTIDVVRWTHASDHFACWIRTHQDLTFQDLTIYLLTFGEFSFCEKQV